MCLSLQCSRPLLYLMWRLTWAIYHTCWLVVNLVAVYHIPCSHVYTASSAHNAHGHTHNGSDSAHYAPQHNPVLSEVINNSTDHTTHLSDVTHKNVHLDTCQLIGWVGVAKWFIYLSHWLYFLITCHAVVEAALIIIKYRSTRGGKHMRGD